MKKEVIMVPRNKSVFDVLTEMGKETKNSWIFFHQNLYRKLYRRSYSTITPVDIILVWEYPKREIYFETFANSNSIWIKVLKITDDNIEFTVPSADPENIYFFQLKEES